MARIKDKNKKNDQVKMQAKPPLGHISFSLKYVPNNKKHSFEYFERDVRNAHRAYEALFSKMKSLCQTDISAAYQVGKIQGCEPIPYCRLSETMRSICDTVEIISRDSSLLVFRFCQNDYRLLCKSDLNHPNLLHIIGFDFNFSAYDHG